jgi:hypothetical protein
MQAVRDDTNQQTGVPSLTMDGSVSDSSKLKSNTRNQRKNIAKSDSGASIVWSFSTNPGYIDPVPKTAETMYQQSGLDEDYRNNSFRLIEVKDSYPIASIQILSRKKGGGRLSSSGYKVILPPYTKFMLTDVRVTSNEKYHLYTTFRSFRVNFFDANPEVWNFSGFLLNTENHNWSSEFRSLYHAYLRGTECAKIGAECYITFQDTIVSGLMLNSSHSFSSGTPNGIPISFQLLITNEFVFSETQLINVLQRKLYPTGTKGQPQLVFQLVREHYRRTYGQAEKRAGVVVQNEIDTGKLSSELSNDVNQIVTNTVSGT